MSIHKFKYLIPNNLIFWQNKAIEYQGVTEICILLIINKLQCDSYTCWPLTPTGGSGIVPTEHVKDKKNFSIYQIYFTVGKDATPSTLSIRHKQYLQSGQDSNL